jgi:valyl-tRNA synthetase
MVTEQWFVKMGPLAERAVRETREGRLHFHPDRWGKVYEHWLDNVRDWCISRQIWWGHRIPAWHCAACAKATVATEAPTACKHCGSAKLTQDPDVLDTWFSSALWPYSTLGWPDWEAAAKHYFPTSTLVTDRGIIFFWVARMVMTSLFANEVRPFDDVFIHGTVLDERGDKMSKSKGNGIDPIVMIEGGSQMYLKKQYDCPGYGADAVRYTLLDMTTEGQDLKLSPTKFETGRNFANKVWNAGRFVLMNLGERSLPAAAPVRSRRGASTTTPTAPTVSSATISATGTSNGQNVPSRPAVPLPMPPPRCCPTASTACCACCTRACHSSPSTSGSSSNRLLAAPRGPGST